MARPEVVKQDGEQVSVYSAGLGEGTVPGTCNKGLTMISGIDRQEILEDFSPGEERGLGLDAEAAEQVRKSLTGQPSGSSTDIRFQLKVC